MELTRHFVLGILEDYASDQKLPLPQRYIHQIRMDGTIKIAVAMVPELAALLHDPGVRYLEGDITFKRTKGEMNEWEAAIWYTPTLERKSFLLRDAFILSFFNQVLPLPASTSTRSAKKHSHTFLTRSSP